MRLPLFKLKRKPTRKVNVLKVLCVPSTFCLRCPIDEREQVCFFKQPKPASISPR